MLYHIRRLAGYVLGFVLFYAPFALFQRSLEYALSGRWQPMSIHSLCFRIPIEHLLDGKFLRFSAVSVLGTVILLLSACLLGPVFCGRLCPAGAFTEYLSKLVPSRWQISWRRYTEITPVRYGMLAGFCLVPFFDGVLACAYCNFFVFDLLANYYTQGYFIALNSSLLLTAVLWLGVFGLFTKGGRGFCNFLCPVGAAQSLAYAVSSRLPFVRRMQVKRQVCIGCGECAKHCPMEAVTMEQGKAAVCLHNCIVCGVCRHVCPVQAIGYGRRDDEK